MVVSVTPVRSAGPPKTSGGGAGSGGGRRLARRPPSGGPLADHARFLTAGAAQQNSQPHRHATQPPSAHSELTLSPRPPGSASARLRPPARLRRVGGCPAG